MVLTDEMRFTIKACFEQKGWRGARLVSEFPHFKWTKQSINRMIKKLQDTGSCGRKRGSGRPKTALSTDDKRQVDELACSQEERPGQHLSQRKIARTLGKSRSSVQRHLKSKNMKAFKRLIVPPMSDKVKQKRKSRARHLYQKIGNAEVQSVVFTDEKDFTLEVPINPQNNRVYGSGKKSDVPPTRLYHEKSRFSKKVMVSAGVSYSGKTKIFFLETENAKVNSAAYIRLLQENLLPACRKLHPSGFILQQDGAPSHTSKATQECLARHCRFIAKSEWPPNSPDLNPLDYHVWDALSEAVYRQRREKFETIAELKAAIVAAWEEVSLTTIKKSILQWKPRLRAVVQADGGPISHLFK